MLCDRTPLTDIPPSRDDVSSGLLNKRLGLLAGLSGRVAVERDHQDPMTARLPIALTCGEPAGIGPELAVLARQILGDEVPFFWIGDPRHLPAGCAYQVIDAPGQVGALGGVCPCWRMNLPSRPSPASLTPRNAQGVIDVIARAVDLVRAGQASAICTSPIHKKALQDGAGFAYPGHTEFLAHLGGDVPVVMMLASPLLRVVPVTIHIALDQVATALTAELLEQTIRLTHAGLIRDFRHCRAASGRCRAEPPCGRRRRDGAGRRSRLITPVLDRLRAEGMILLGPMSADTMFHARARASYDAAVCMYHDQALIPIKTLDFDGGVNVTLGLPFIRTSPDHGTGFDIAGKGMARPDSLIAALRMAAEMAKGRAGVASIDGLPPLREVIRAHDLVAKRQLGQNFLLDLNLTAKIARLAGDLYGLRCAGDRARPRWSDARAAGRGGAAGAGRLKKTRAALPPWTRLRRFIRAV